jgi:hypothetical protein
MRGMSLRFLCVIVRKGMWCFANSPLRYAICRSWNKDLRTVDNTALSYASAVAQDLGVRLLALHIFYREEGDVVFRELALEVRHLPELEVDTARTTVVGLVVAGRKDVQSEQAHPEVL